MATDLAIPNVVWTLKNSDEVSFEELDNMLKRALHAEAMTTAIAQACFSAIIIRNRWKEAKIWADDEGTMYLFPDEAPKDVKLSLTKFKRYRSVDEWISTLKSVRGFARSTCYARHTEIVRQMEVLNRPFEDAVSGVVLSPGHSRLLMDHIADDTMFIPEMVVKLLPPLMRETGLAEIEKRGKEYCREIVLDQLEADEERLEAGIHPRQVIADLKRSLGTYAVYTVRMSDRGRSFVITHDKKGVLKKYRVFIEAEDPREETPLEVIHWLSDRLHVEIVA